MKGWIVPLTLEDGNVSSYASALDWCTPWSNAGFPGESGSRSRPQILQKKENRFASQNWRGFELNWLEMTVNLIFWF
jgi:hypothetical protein